MSTPQYRVNWCRAVDKRDGEVSYFDPNGRSMLLPRYLPKVNELRRKAGLPPAGVDACPSGRLPANFAGAGRRRRRRRR